MTQANITTTIATFLKSRYLNSASHLDGLAVDKNGNFLHYNEIINNTYNELFKDMELSEYVDDEFKKEFCKRFYNREIGIETFARFQILLENDLNTKCLNLLQARYFLKTKSIEELNQSIDIKNDNLNKGDNQTLGISNVTPQDRLEITFTEKYGVIEYANALQENHNKYENKSNSRSHGWQGSSLADRIDNIAHITNLTNAILNMLEDLFLQVY